MTKIEKTMRDCYGNGQLSFSECAAIIGAVELVATILAGNTPFPIDSDSPLDDMRRNWLEQYGTLAGDSINGLTSE